MNIPKVTFCAVWREAPDFPVESVYRLFAQLRLLDTRDVNFVCVSDKQVPCGWIETRRIIHAGWPGFWSKVELFRPGLFTEEDGTIVSFDLDTIINKIPEVPTPGENEIYPIHEMDGRRVMQSAVMCWKGGSCNAYYHDLVRWRKEKHFTPAGRRSARRNRDRAPKGAFPAKGDGQFLRMRSKALGIQVKFLQDHGWKIKSYKKWVCRRGGNPEKQDIICFHGRPRPQAAKDEWTINKLKRADDITEILHAFYGEEGEDLPF